MILRRRRPLTLHNGNSNSSTVLDQPPCKRKRKAPSQSTSDHNESDSEIENRPLLSTSDGKSYRLLYVRKFYNTLFLEFAVVDDDDRSSGIQTRSTTASKRKNMESSDNGM